MNDNPIGTGPSLLEQIPRTDPDVLNQISAERIQIRHYAVIGMVASEWAFLEAMLDVALTDLAGGEDPRKIVCFTGQMMGHRPRLDAYISLCRHLGMADKWGKILDDFSKDVVGLAEQRNRAVHDAWQFPLGEPHRFEASARRRLTFKLIHVPTDDLYRLVKNITALTSRFESEIMEPLYDELLPSLRKDFRSPVA